MAVNCKFFKFFPAALNRIFTGRSLDFAQLVKISLVESIPVFLFFSRKQTFLNPSFQHLFQSFENAHEFLFSSWKFYRRH